MKIDGIKVPKNLGVKEKKSCGYESYNPKFLIKYPIVHGYTNTPANKHWWSITRHDFGNGDFDFRLGSRGANYWMVIAHSVKDLTRGLQNFLRKHDCKLIAFEV